MDYKIIRLDKKCISGIGVRTNNTSADMGEKIGKVWQEFFAEQMPAGFCGRIGQSTYGVYTNYESDAAGDYDFIAGVQTDGTEENSDKLKIIVVPEGKYAKFTVMADMEALPYDIGRLWQTVWKSDLDRAYIADFEEYTGIEKEGKQEINLYIGLKG